MNEELLNQLNPPQREAVETTEGPLLVLAGAGSGKTRVLTYRIANLIDKGVAPWNILAITFTNKAAKEMADRVEALVGGAVNEMWVRTFHSACVRILRRDIERLGYGRNFNIIDADDQKTLVKECIRELRMDEDEFPHKTVMSEISGAKDSLLTPDEYIKEYGSEFRLAEIGKIYRLYQRKLQNANDLDFDDLIMLTVQLFNEAPDVLSFYQNKFKYILVDEYQDTNRAQNELIMLLAGEHRNICVVGDDDQSIYRFRGADVTNILEFEDRFPDVKTIRLEQNYRSTQNILDAANSVIKNNQSRKSKSLWTDSGAGEKITVYRASNDFDEGDYVVSTINSLVKEGYKYGDIALLFRARSSSKVIEDIFMRAAVPYRVLSGLRFYDRKEIRDMIAYLRLIKNPDDDISLRRIINVPSRKVGKVTMDVIASVAAREGVSLYRAIEGHADEFKGGVAEFFSVMQQLRELVGTVPIDELVKSTYEISGYAKSLEKDEKGAERMENVGELISGAKHYIETVEEPSFDDYMDNLVLVSDVDNYDENLDAVVMMTMHAAKGLEFPVVIVCGFDDGIFPGAKSIYDPDEIQEERRLCYVALTRARKKLFLTGAHSRMTFGKTSVYRPSRFLGEIPEELYDMKDAKEELITRRERLRESMPQINKKSKSYELHIPAAKPEATAPKGDLTLRSGDMVRHAKFGDGVIISAQAVGNDVHYKINFEGVGEKNLLGLYAKLTKIN
ncbi:MAG: UvrD-helicase domain-containing protein [Oscillospiraceae bacterium]|nr:UvrD-helicase domain-containing protein [Oscillospiraceae bacterium]